MKKVDDFNKELTVLFKYLCDNNLIDSERELDLITNNKLKKLNSEFDFRLLASQDYRVFDQLVVYVDIFDKDLKEKLEIPDTIDIESFSLDSIVDIDTKSHKDYVFSSIENLFKSIAKKQVYNQYLNFKDRYEKDNENVKKNRANKIIRKVMPIILRIYENIDKNDLNEIVTLFRSSKSGYESIQSLLKEIMSSGFNVNEVMKKYDIDLSK